MVRLINRIRVCKEVRYRIELVLNQITLTLLTIYRGISFNKGANSTLEPGNTTSPASKILGNPSFHQLSDAVILLGGTRIAPLSLSTKLILPRLLRAPPPKSITATNSPPPRLFIEKPYPVVLIISVFSTNNVV